MRYDFRFSWIKSKRKITAVIGFPFQRIQDLIAASFVDTWKDTKGQSQCLFFLGYCRSIFDEIWWTLWKRTRHDYEFEILH